MRGMGGGNQRMDNSRGWKASKWLRSLEEAGIWAGWAAGKKGRRKLPEKLL